MTKKCTKCLLTKDVSCFHKKGPRYQSRCKECCSKQSKKYYKDNKQAISQTNKKYYQENKQAILERAKKPKSEKTLEQERLRDAGLKKCCKCLLIKDVSCFHKRGSGSGYKSDCKECRSRKSDATKLREKRKANGEKLCPDCNTVKPHSCFYKNKQRGINPYCKSCVSKQCQLYHVNNADKIRAKSKKYYEDNKQAISERARIRYRENKEHILKLSQDYYQMNKKRYRARDAKRRADMLAATPDDADLKIIRLIYENCPDGYEVDHIVPIDRGGLHHQDNLAYLPMSINRRKGTKLVEEFPEFHEHVIYPKLEEQYGRAT